jgi:hypothetical protein
MSKLWYKNLASNKRIIFGTRSWQLVALFGKVSDDQAMDDEIVHDNYTPADALV